MLTRRQLEVAAKRAAKWPPGHGTDFFVKFVKGATCILLQTWNSGLRLSWPKAASCYPASRYG